MPESYERKLLSPAWGHLNKSPIVRGEGLYVYDTAGKRFMDFTSGIGVTATGHCHPTVVHAIQEQAARLVFGQINCMIPEPTLRSAVAMQAARATLDVIRWLPPLVVTAEQIDEAVNIFASAL